MYACKRSGWSHIQLRCENGMIGDGVLCMSLTHKLITSMIKLILYCLGVFPKHLVCFFKVIPQLNEALHTWDDNSCKTKQRNNNIFIKCILDQWLLRDQFVTSIHYTCTLSIFLKCTD